ncbi:MAG TPA: 16S rRNA (adenine(1518)-N(6)/adenine(1519)-N(6))-dimethyltransferase RsmA [Patescibacteria group bacterium]
MSHPKKSLGQNFLRDEKVLKKIISSANLNVDDFVLEIGPGKGVLTEELAKHAGKVLALEIDSELCNLLRNKFSNKKKVEIANADILKINLTELFPHPANATLSLHRERGLGGEGGYKVVANLPYYITSPIIRLFLESENPPSEMILMVQKEVAERIVARPGKMSILALSVQYYARAELLFAVNKNSFFPVPKVDSCVIKIVPYPHSSPLPEGEGEFRKKFFRIVRAGFSAKRKMLANNLANGFHLDKKEVEEKLKKAGISPTARAQELSIEHWKILAKIFR